MERMAGIELAFSAVCRRRSACMVSRARDFGYRVRVRTVCCRCFSLPHGSVHRAAGKGLNWSPLPPIDAKGFDEPVPVFTLNPG